ncbi:hypothetical protein TH59_05490 [Pantoea ananatis]|nr:hypothetical protein B7764_13895 [Pantoea ananatis]PWW13548.1 hypothetical protein DFO57_106139 [Pantoea sp. AG702]AVG76025.1 hypothetical protein B9Q16_08375 [Pantoea ananatis]MDC7864401.1 hypothetical protein [Pantoea ananatis]PQK89551.1 hypothetical protein CG432_12810 [Pantoea ananatis]
MRALAFVLFYGNLFNGDAFCISMILSIIPLFVSLALSRFGESFRRFYFVLPVIIGCPNPAHIGTGTASVGYLRTSL